MKRVKAIIIHTVSEKKKQFCNFLRQKTFILLCAEVGNLRLNTYMILYCDQFLLLMTYLIPVEELLLLLDFISYSHTDFSEILSFTDRNRTSLSNKLTSTIAEISADTYLSSVSDLLLTQNRCNQVIQHVIENTNIFVYFTFLVDYIN